MVGQSLALRPDVIVIFAGNNWATDITGLGPPVYRKPRPEGGSAGDKILRRCVPGGTRATAGEPRDSLLAPRAVKVIWVVPDFNLGDWTDPPSNAPILAGRATSSGVTCASMPARAMRERDLVAAEKSAKKMVELDGGTSSVPLRVLAECARSEGDLQGTRRYLEMCRDAEGWDPSFKFPRVCRHQAKTPCARQRSAHNNAIINLPDILSRHLNDALPDRRISWTTAI